MKFTTPVSMPVTEAQYNELKPLLEAMGYEAYYWEYDAYIRCIKPLALSSTIINLTAYRPDIFIALAAMTDEPNGIAGEWWKYNDFDNRHFTPNKIYKAIRPINMTAAFPDDMGVANGFIHGNDSYFTKATVAEIFAHFGVSEGKVNDEPIQPKIIQPIPFQGIDRRTYLAGCVFMGLCSLKETDPKKITPALIVKKTDVLISELDKNK